MVDVKASKGDDTGKEKGGKGEERKNKKANIQLSRETKEKQWPLGRCPCHQLLQLDHLHPAGQLVRVTPASTQMQPPTVTPVQLTAVKLPLELRSMWPPPAADAATAPPALRRVKGVHDEHQVLG